MYKIFINGIAHADIMIDPDGVYMGPHHYDMNNFEVRRIIDQYLQQNYSVGIVYESIGDIEINDKT